MSSKHPAWTRTKVGRDRVHWVAYDDRINTGDRQIVDQGYAASLAEADAAARAALAAAGMYQARRISTAFGASSRGNRDQARTPARPEQAARPLPREYLFSRRHADGEDGPLMAAHLVVKKTARRVYVTRRSLGPDQIGSEDENWEPDERTIALDRARLERDGSVYSGNLSGSDFYTSRQAAEGDSPRRDGSPLAVLGLRAPCTAEDIKTAYRRRALEVHPDRGGTPAQFLAVEAAYRRLLREAQVADV